MSELIFASKLATTSVRLDTDINTVVNEYNKSNKHKITDSSSLSAFNSKLDYHLCYNRRYTVDHKKT